MTVWWIVGGVIVASVLVGAVLTKKPIRALTGSAVQGLCALAAVNVASAFSGVSLGVTTFSVLVGVVLGIPGVATLLVLQVLLGGL